LEDATRLDLRRAAQILRAKNNAALVALATCSARRSRERNNLALVHAYRVKAGLEVDSKLAPHPVKSGLIRVDEKTETVTTYEVRVCWSGSTDTRC